MRCFKNKHASKEIAQEIRNDRGPDEGILLRQGEEESKRPSNQR